MGSTGLHRPQTYAWALSRVWSKDVRLPPSTPGASMNDITQAQQRLEAFKGVVVANDALAVVRRHVVTGDGFLLSDSDNYQLCAAVASRFDVHLTQVFVVGSAKLGFSIAPGKRFRLFGETSDIDITLVSKRLFDKVWKAVFRFRHEGGYWDKQREFSEFLFRGWMRPDLLPPESSFEFCREWWEFFRGLTSSGEYGPYKLRAALYRDWEFFEAYHAKAVRQCAEAVTG